MRSTESTTSHTLALSLSLRHSTRANACHEKFQKKYAKKVVIPCVKSTKISFYQYLRQIYMQKNAHMFSQDRIHSAVKRDNSNLALASLEIASYVIISRYIAPSLSSAFLPQKVPLCVLQGSICAIVIVRHNSRVQLENPQATIYQHQLLFSSLWSFC